ncbi:uncharacterized protein isoform X2 [Choristoneura fumiferana]
MKLKSAYDFRHEILQAKERLISAQATVTNKQYSEIEYLEDMPFDTNYDIDTVLNSETGQMPYTLDEIYDGKEINENDEPSFLLQLDNDAVVDKVLFNNSNDNVSEIMRTNDMHIDNAGSDLDLLPNESYLLDKPVENYSIDILSDILVDNDLEPGEIRVIDKIDKHYIVDAHHDIIVDKKKVIIKSKGKINAKDNNLVKMLNLEAGPVGIVGKIPEGITRLVDVPIDEKDEASKGNIDQKSVTRNTKDKDEIVLNQAETIDKSNTKDLIKNKKKVIKRVVKVKRDEISLLAQICTKLQNPDENTVNTAKEVNDPKVNDAKTKDESMNLMDTDVGDTSASKEAKSKKRSKKNAGKKEASVKENDSGNVEKVKAKKPKKEKKPKPPSQPFTLQPDQTVCDLCSARFETPHALSNHMNWHYPQFACGECGQAHATRNRLRQHMRIHEEGPFVCKVCDKEFSNSNTRNAHTWRVHSKGDPFKCRHCSLRFPTFLQRLRHVQSAHGETPEYVCQFCQAKFAYAANRTKHIRTVHLKERPHRCQHCPSAFTRARNLAAHLASKHGEGQKSYRCPICGISFYFRHALRFHVSQHSHKYPCSQCDQKFLTSAELESHRQIHEHADNMSINLDFVTSLHLDALADDYSLIDPSYLDLNEL